MKKKVKSTDITENKNEQVSKNKKRKLKLFITETIINEQLRIKQHKQYSEYKLVNVYSFQECECCNKNGSKKSKIKMAPLQNTTQTQIY